MSFALMPECAQPIESYSHVIRRSILEKKQKVIPYDSPPLLSKEEECCDLATD